LSDHARLKISLSQREIEIEGSEAFVEGWAERLAELIAYFPAGNGTEPNATIPAETPAKPSELGAFGEFIQQLPNAATEVDKMLAAGLWVQRQSVDDAFSTGDASRHLTEHGIRVGNPSQCVRQSLMAKRLFMLQRGRYRISQQGLTYLRQIIGPAARL
jgi:hypothetical protein